MFCFVFKVNTFDDDAFDDIFDQENEFESISDNPRDFSPIVNESTNASQLIGTSDKRDAFFSELQDEVRRSKVPDQEKVRKIEWETRETQRREGLCLSRQARVFPEVEIDDPSHMLICVRHVSFGVVTQAF
jgi:hypothetical protein